jgi:hypothetical protein
LSAVQKLQFNSKVSTRSEDAKVDDFIRVLLLTPNERMVHLRNIRRFRHNRNHYISYIKRYGAGILLNVAPGPFH